MQHLVLNWHVFLLILALVLALLAGLNTPTPPRINLGWLSFFCFLLSVFFVSS